MQTRDRWLDAGLRILASDGIRAVTIERLCDDVALSKGSFYHHFRGIGDFRTALLAHFAERETERYVDAAERGSGDARARLARLQAVVAAGGDAEALERAVRAWASQDDDARAALESVDRRRVEYLTGLLVEVLGDQHEAEDVALLVYLTLLGSHQVLPTVPLTRVERLWDRLLRDL